MKWEPVEARHSRMRQKKARVTTGDQGESPGSLLCGRDAGFARHLFRGSSSTGRALSFQVRCCGFKSREPLQTQSIPFDARPSYSSAERLNPAHGVRT